MYVLGAGFWVLGSLGASLLHIPWLFSRGGSMCVVLCHPRVLVPGKMQVSVVSFPCFVSRWIKFPSFRFCEIEEQNVCSLRWFLSIGITGGQPLEYPRQKDKAPWLFSRGGSMCVALCHPRVVGPGKMHVSVVSFPCLVSRWVKFPSSRFFEIEENYECSWCWFLSIGITGGQPLEIFWTKRQSPRGCFLGVHDAVCVGAMSFGRPKYSRLFLVLGS